MSIKFKRLGMSEADVEQEELASKQKFKGSRKKEVIAVYNAPLPSEADLDQFERQVGVGLPLEYRRFLKEVNGGEPSENLLWDADKERVVNYLFSLTAPESSNFSIKKNLIVYEGRFPGELICIGSAGGGDLILLSVRGRKIGAIYYWDHNLEAEYEGGEYWDNIEYISDSLSEFFDMLHG